MSGLITNNMSTLVANSLFQQLTSTFQELETSNDTAAVKALREEAFAHFSSQGFPTVKNEDWKYTNIHSLINRT